MLRYRYWLVFRQTIIILGYIFRLHDKYYCIFFTQLIYHTPILYGMGYTLLGDLSARSSRQSQSSISVNYDSWRIDLLMRSLPTLSVTHESLGAEPIFPKFPMRRENRLGWLSQSVLLPLVLPHSKCNFSKSALKCGSSNILSLILLGLQRCTSLSTRLPHCKYSFNLKFKFIYTFHLLHFHKASVLSLFHSYCILFFLLLHLLYYLKMFLLFSNINSSPP